MKRNGVIFLILVFIGFIVYINLSNGISGIESITVEKYDSADDEYIYVKVISDQDTIKKVTQILNRARHARFTSYEMAYAADYKLTVIYKENLPLQA